MSAPRKRSKTRGGALMSVALVMLINATTQLTQLNVSAQSTNQNQNHHQILMSNNNKSQPTGDSLPSSQSKHSLQPFGGSQQLRNQNTNEEEPLMTSASQPAAVEVDVADGGDLTSDTPDSGGSTASDDALDGEEEPTGSGDVPVASDEDDGRSPTTSTTEASTAVGHSAYEAVHLRPSRQSHVIAQQQQQPTTSTPTSTTLRAIVASRQPQAMPTTTLRSPAGAAVALDVNMGADLMLIKPPITWADSSSSATTTTTSLAPLMSDEIDRRNLAAFQARHNQLVNKSKQQQQQNVDLLNSLASSPVPLRSTTTTTTAATGELAVESVNHQQQVQPNQLQINERRQDLLYPHHHQVQQNFNGGDSLPVAESTFNQFTANNMPHTSNNDHHSACYTPVSLISVIIITMLITIAGCLGARQLFKYLSRHQFGK